MRKVHLLATAAMIIVAASPLTAQIVEPIGSAASGSAAAVPVQRLNPTGHQVTLDVPMRASGPLGQVQITIEADDALYVSARDFANALSRIVRAPEVDRILASADSSGRLSAEQAAKLGYVLRYDSSNAELVVDFAPELLATRTIMLSRGSAVGAVQPDRSADVAGYLNYRIGAQQRLSGVDKGDTDFVGDFELAGRLGRTIAFDNFATVNTRLDHSFTRTASRIFYDIPQASLRMTAGDLLTLTTGFQTDPQISGINVSKLVDTFFFSSAVSGTSSRNLVLNRAADVQIIVNGVPVSQIRLNPGSYDLRNLPVAQGANNLQAVITDETGERRVQSFSFFQSAQLLNPGIEEYTLSAGVLAPLRQRGPHYTDNLALTGFYRRGISNQLTLGANLQLADIDQVVGIDGVVGTNLGLFVGNIAFNHLREGKSGYAARVQYSYASGTNSEYFARTFDLLVEYNSPYFQPLSAFSLVNATAGIPDLDGNIIPLPGFDLENLTRNAQALLVTGSVSQPFTQTLSLQINGTYSHGRDGFGDRGSLSALVTYQAPFRTTLGLGATYQWAPRTNFGNFTTGRGLSFLATLTHRFGPRSLVTASVDRFAQRASFSRTPEHVIDDYFVNADVSHNRLGTLGNGIVGYITNRGNVQATYNTALDRGGDIVSQQAGLFFTGSVAVANDHIAIGRRITDAFAIVAKDSTLGDRQVIVQSRFAKEVIARSGLFGPAVVPVSSYQRSLIPYDVADLPPGYDLGTGAFDIYAWYRSGFALKVGSPYNISALGELVDANGNPLALRAGSAMNLDDSKAPKVDVVTNRAGRFAATGLSAGRYRITMSDDASLVYDIVVRSNADMLMRFDAIRPNGH